MNDKVYGKKVRVVKMVGGNLILYSKKAEEKVEQLMETGDFYEYVSILLEEHLNSESSLEQVSKSLKEIQDKMEENQKALAVPDSSTKKVERSMESMMRMMASMQKEISTMKNLIPSNTGGSSYTSVPPSNIVEVEEIEAKTIEKKAGSGQSALANFAKKFKMGK